MSLSVDGVWKSGVWATTVWADGVWMEGSAYTVIGRKRRRGKFHPRYEEIVEQVNDGKIESLAKEYAKKVIEQAREIASARTDLEIAKNMMKKGQEKMARLAVLEARVIEAEERMVQLKEEEDFIVVLALSI